MPNIEPKIVETKLFVSYTKENLKLTDAIVACGTTFHGAVALLYAPHKCFLATVNSNGKFQDNQGEIDASAVFEARVFNNDAELRWLNKENGEGTSVVLCEDQTKKFFDVTKADEKIYAKIEPSQTYLLWGESIGATDGNGWTRFAEARIRPFFVPIGGINANKKQRAQFTAIEYLGEFEDGNIAVTEERLTGVKAV